MSQDGSASVVSQDIGPSNWLSFRLSVLSSRLAHHASESIMRSHGLLLTEWRVVAVLGEQGPLTGAQLSERTAINRSWISRALQRLENRKLVVRSPDPRHGRRVAVALSPAGQAVFAEIGSRSEARNALLLASLTEAERVFLFSILDRLEAHASMIIEEKDNVI